MLLTAKGFVKADEIGIALVGIMTAALPIWM